MIGCVTGLVAVVAGPVTVQTSASLRPGVDVSEIINSRIGTMTINNTLSLAGTALMQINRTNTPNSDRVVGVTTLTCGGVLAVTNCGPALQAGDTFTLFIVESFFDVFTELSLAPLDPGLAWDTSRLYVDGSIAVAGPPLTKVEVQVTTTNLLFTWPPDQGWILQQADAVTGPWTNLATTTNYYQVLPTQPNEYFRLKLGP